VIGDRFLISEAALINTDPQAAQAARHSKQRMALHAAEASVKAEPQPTTAQLTLANQVSEPSSGIKNTAQAVPALCCVLLAAC